MKRKRKANTNHSYITAQSLMPTCFKITCFVADKQTITRSVTYELWRGGYSLTGQWFTWRWSCPLFTSEWIIPSSSNRHLKCSLAYISRQVNPYQRSQVTDWRYTYSSLSATALRFCTTKEPQPWSGRRLNYLASPHFTPPASFSPL